MKEKREEIAANLAPGGVLYKQLRGKKLYDLPIIKRDKQSQSDNSYNTLGYYIYCYCSQDCVCLSAVFGGILADYRNFAIPQEKTEWLKQAQTYFRTWNSDNNSSEVRHFSSQGLRFIVATAFKGVFFNSEGINNIEIYYLCAYLHNKEINTQFLSDFFDSLSFINQTLHDPLIKNL